VLRGTHPGKAFHQVSGSANVREETVNGYSPAMPVRFTFRPFTEADARRTLAWDQCCGPTDGNNDGGGDGDVGDEQGTSYSFTSGGDSVTAPPPSPTGHNHPSRHEYQRLDRPIGNRGQGARDESDTIPTCFTSDCGSCCPAVDYCIGTLVGSEVTLLEERFVTKEILFQDKLKEFHWRVMLTRLGCYLMLATSIFLMLRPIASFLSFLPYVGYVLLRLFWLAALIGGVVMGGVITCTAWVLYRPFALAGMMMCVV
jgi:hypothetical protein